MSLVTFGGQQAQAYHFVFPFFCRRIKSNVAHELPAAVDVAVAVAVKHPVIRQLVSKLVAVEVVPSGFRF